MVARTLAAFARRLRPAALGAACALVPPVMATAAVCSASDPLYPRRWVAALSVAIAKKSWCTVSHSPLTGLKTSTAVSL